VDTGAGLDTNTGLGWDTSFKTMAKAFTVLESGDTIIFVGRVEEQISTPVQVFDVTIIGAGNRPRHSDAAPAPVGGVSAALWKSAEPETATTPLLTVQQQGWRLENFLMDAPSDDACVQLFRNAGAGDAERDASHFSAYGVKFANGVTGIEDNGGCHHYLIDNCEFRALTNGITCISTSVAVPLQDIVRNCIFSGNTNDIISSYSTSLIEDNIFYGATTEQINTIFNSAQGAANMVINNTFAEDEGDITNLNGYTGSATDIWRNFSQNVPAMTVGVPS
jgi:hypothetical protein